MKRILNLFGLAAALCLAASCATESKDAAQKSGPPATCQVCRYDNDLACVNVRVTGTTPRAEYQGTTYYFCSDECRKAFLKNPSKYLPQPKKS